jgi:hypothetical protein
VLDEMVEPFAHPSWNPISSCFFRVSSSLWMAIAVYFVPFPWGSKMTTAVMKGSGFGRQPGPRASVQSSRRFYRISRKHPRFS